MEGQTTALAGDTGDTHSRHIGGGGGGVISGCVFTKHSQRHSQPIGWGFS